MVNHKNNQGQQTELVKNSLIRYIRDCNLSVGDKLPTQAELRKKLNVGSETIRRAVYFLRDSGILELRGNKGIFLSSENADGSLGRQIGVVCMRIPAYTYGVNLIQCMELQLHDRGCQPVIFLRDDAVMNEHDSISLFSGLLRNVRQHLIDGLITTVPLDDETMRICAKNNVPVCYFGNHTEFPHRVFVDQSFYADGLNELVRIGSRRPGIMFSGYPEGEETTKLFREVAEPLVGKNQWEKYLFSVNHPPQLQTTPQQMWASWQELADRIIAMPEEARPDGLFIPDDFMTNYIVCYLLQKKVHIPPVITYRNRQIPIGMPFDLAGYFEGDIMETARLSVDLLLRQINEPGLKPTEIFYKPEYIALQS